jgi:hypothetical protein
VLKLVSIDIGPHLYQLLRLSTGFANRGLCRRKSNHGVVLTKAGVLAAKTIQKGIKNDRRKRNYRKI